MRQLAVLAVLLVPLLMSSNSMARSPAQRQYLGETSGTPVDMSAHRALAYGASEEPPWVAPVLDELTAGRPTGYAIVQHLLFRRDGAATFLAVIWQRDSLFERRFTLYRIDGTTPPRLKAVRSLDDAHLEMVEPSGHDIHGDGVATLFFEEGSGGTSLYGYRLHVIKLGRHAIDISPPGRPVMAEDLDGDGRWEIVASDDRWANFFFPCGQCGPLVPVVYAWGDGRYRMACDRHKALVNFRLQMFNEPEEFASWPSRDQTRLDMERALLHLQVQDSDAAQRLYSRAVARLRQAGEEERPLLNLVEAGFGALMKAAPALAQRACPVQAGKGGGHYGDPID